MRKRTLLALIGASVLAGSAGAAAAQGYDGYRHDGWYGGRGWTDNQGRWMSINARQAQLDRRIERGLQAGQLTPREAMRLRAEFNRISRLERSYRYNGLSPRERADLDRRFDRLAMQIRFERRDGDRDYGYGYGY